jgi:L-fucose isomerase-like protein
MRIGVIALARGTFDLDAAGHVTGAAITLLHRLAGTLGHTLVGDHRLVTDDTAATVAVAQLLAQRPDVVVVLQGTFTTAVAVEALAASWNGPVVLWGFPEPPGGDRLRLNSLCGITLASATLHRLGADVRWVHGSPDGASTSAQLEQALEPRRERADPRRAPRSGLPAAAVAAATRTAEQLRGTRIGRLGLPPNGFSPCRYGPDVVRDHVGVVVDEIPLEALFEAANATTDDEVDTARRQAAEHTVGIDTLDRVGVDRSVRLLTGLQHLAERHGWAALATRCWPECMTDYGGAVCWASASMADQGIPAGCEADVPGTMTNLALQLLTGRPAFLADLVDVDDSAGTGTLWHCGVAAASLAREGRPVEVRNHPNRAVPMVLDFELAPGRVTLARLMMRDDDTLVLVIGGGTLVDAGPRLRGTSARVRFDRPVEVVLDRLLGDGLDHHVSVGYGDVRAELEALAGLWRLEVIDL